METALRKIVVLRCAGSGKTALAMRLGREMNLPVVILDGIWKKKLTPDDVPAFRDLVAGAHRGDSWVSDGNFAVATFDVRLPRADLIVWLERPRSQCIWRVVRRAFSSDDQHHRIRALPDVLTFIWSFERVNRPLIESARLIHGPTVPVVHLAGDKAISDFLHNFENCTSYE